MFGQKATRTTESVINGLINRHGALLKPDEQFVAACEAFSPSGAHPPPLKSGRWTPRSPQSPDQIAELIAEAHRRLADVRSAMGLSSQDELDELPVSDNGYLLAHSTQRLFVFDGSGQTYQLQAATRGLWLQAIEHANGIFTLVFRSGEDMVAVSTRRESASLTQAFIDSFPDRRHQARVVSTSTRDDTMGFPFTD